MSRKERVNLMVPKYVMEIQVGNDVKNKTERIRELLFKGYLYEQNIEEGKAKAGEKEQGNAVIPKASPNLLSNASPDIFNSWGDNVVCV